MKTRMYAILSLGVVVILLVWGVTFYVNSLQEAPPPIEQEKKGRAKYLIDSRWPFIDLPAIFGFDDE